MPIRFLRGARIDFLAAAAFYESEAARLSAAFVATVEDALNLLASAPRIGSPYEDTTRRIILPRFPYSLIYEVADDEVVIVAVAHHRREPGFWNDRAP